jgi:hypothetical protein
MLNGASAAHREQSPQLGVLRLGAKAPERVIQPVGFKDHTESQRLVISLSLAKMAQELCPPLGTRAMRPDSI